MSLRQAMLDKLNGKQLERVAAPDAEGPTDPGPEEPVEEPTLGIGKRFSLPTKSVKKPKHKRKV